VECSGSQTVLAGSPSLARLSCLFFALRTLAAQWEASCTADLVDSLCFLLKANLGHDGLPRVFEVVRLERTPLVIGSAVLAAGSFPDSSRRSARTISRLTIFAFVCFVVAGGLCFGKAWMRSGFFAFLIFWFRSRTVGLLAGNGCKLASADAANLSSTFPHPAGARCHHLPATGDCYRGRAGMQRNPLEPVLFITSLLVAHLFLKSPWRRIALVAFVIPLGILRNGFRILVIGLLCVHYGPQMIHSIIHKRGGPVFFMLSLIPLFLFLWWLLRGETEASGRKKRLPA
jgi:exosortase/archaeosortase family protein